MRLYHLIAGVLTGTLLRHQKGALYRRLYEATDSTNNRAGTPIVIYYSIRKGIVHARTRTEMYEPIVWPDGVTRPRFRTWRLRSS